ncbi:sulfatase-like hydrolase/transferase [Pelagicoccus mobilis]|uniref:Sulfatase-like hydrolase/transferase n=1 Tax=Pelagicoccus mobilis TaxID=415221 RepID=A0A934VPG0_9BACT|nr:sulfatase-like hydrolase/transferase [Pelagicoccus mobilis]MBK1875494.1 sulfatase-like hydrolase/transferase [Pelagicoccus mobilis]
MNSPRAIVLIQSDQHRADCLGCYGHPIVKTPNLDRIAARGARFENAYTPTPICVPARSTLETGQWPVQHGSLCNYDSELANPIEPTVSTWAKDLSAAGWSLDYVGRWHVHPQYSPTDYGYDSFISDHDYHAWREKQGHPPMPQVPSPDPEVGFFGEIDAEIPTDQSQLNWLADQAISRIDKRLKSESPFLIRLDCLQPHLPCRPSQEFADQYDPATIPPWGSFDDDLSKKPYMQGQQLRTWDIESMSWEDWQPVVARYFAEITEMDAAIGRVYDHLETSGILDNTLFIYTSDHGDLCGGHRMLDKHYVMYDDVVRVPLIVSWPNSIESGNTVNDFVSTGIDIPATLRSIAGAKTPQESAALPLLPALQAEGKRSQRTDIYSSYNGNQFGLCSQRMVRDERWKYVFNATWEDELYDLENDPHEKCNLAQLPKYAQALSKLRIRLLDWLEKTNDPLKNYWLEPTLRENRKR